MGARRSTPPFFLSRKLSNNFSKVEVTPGTDYNTVLFFSVKGIIWFICLLCCLVVILNIPQNIPSKDILGTEVAMM